MTLATRTVKGNNSGPYLRRPKIVVMHSTRSGLDWTDAQELGATVNWFTNPDGASAHWVLSEKERVRVVTDDLIAWHSTYLNSRSWGIELTQPTIDRPYRDGHYANAALVGQHYVSLGVAPVWLDYWDGDVSASGFVAHQDTVQGREAGKSDPGPEFDRVRFISSLEDGMPTLDEIKTLIRAELKTQEEVILAEVGQRILEHQGWRLVKGTPSDVYLVTQGRKRHVFSKEAFLASGYSFGMVEVISDAALAKIPSA